MHTIEVQYGTKLGTASLLTARTPSATDDAHLEPNRSQKVRDPVPHRQPPRHSITVDCRSEYVVFQLWGAQSLQNSGMVIFYHYPVLPAILGRSIGRALHKATLLPWLTLLPWFLLSAALRYRQLMYQSHYREGGSHYPLGPLVGWGKARA